MLIVRLENWSTTYRKNDPFLAPELAVVCLQGNVYGHPDFEDGTHVKTPRIIEADGKRITVGSDVEQYDVLLGEIDPGFRKWLAENRPNWNPEEPITMK